MARVDILTPIHKGIRSMIYKLGTEIQTADFTDEDATKALVARLQHNLSVATSRCILCLLHEHGENEDDHLFPKVRAFEPGMVEMLIQEHREIGHKLVGVSEICVELIATKDPQLRIEIGMKLNRSANELFAYYMTHMNKEEVTVLPATWQHLTDEQLLAIRAIAEANMPLAASGFASLQNPIASSNWLLTKNAWWFFAHPIVYFPLLIFLGAIYFLAPRYGKERVPFFKWNYRTWPFYLAFSSLVFSHHVFMDIPNPVWLQMMAQTASLGIVWPSGMTIITVLLFTWRSKMTWNITTRFFIAGIAGWMFGGFQGAETDIYLHNTLSMVGHIHLILLMGPLLFAFAVMYAIIPDLTKKHMSKTLGEIHFWLSCFGGFSLAILFNIIGTEGAARREADIASAFHWAMPYLLFFALLVGIAQFLLVYNFATTLRRKPTQSETTEYEKLHSQPLGEGITYT